MAKTAVADIIIPTEFEKYAIERTAELSAFGQCGIVEHDPAFDRECFSEKGESFDADPVSSATQPLVCDHRPSEFKPYAPRARWIRTANDSYFTAMTFPQGMPTVMQPANLHDATWGAMSAVYGGAIHPSAEGHAAMADAALPAVRQVLGFSQPAPIEAEPLPWSGSADLLGLAGAGGLIALPAGGRRHEAGEEVDVVLRAAAAERGG